jgi:heme-degrading monooxygenase HmoA
MFARLTRAQIKVERIEEFIKRYEGSVVPAAQVQEGFRGIHLLVDRTTGQGISITFWKSEEDAVANERNKYYQEQVAKFINFYTQPPVREGFEVVFQRWAK